MEEEESKLDFWGWLEVFAYIINIWVIAIPFTVLGFACLLFNIFMNIDYNRGWAEGNVWLMLNTMFIILQYTVALPLIYEDQSWLKHAKFIRLLALMSATLYNTIYFLFAWKFWAMIHSFANGDTNPDYFEMFVAMTIIYNLIVHASVVPINVVIMLKEFSMEFYQFLLSPAIVGTDKDDNSLGFH